MNILIVEDKQDARYFLELLLKSKGYAVFTANNGKEALEVLKKQNIQLIISDILMPEMDGFKFCQQVKKDEKLKNIGFIFYTATYVDKKDEEFGLSLGADLFLKKPLEPDIFLAEIEKMISKIQEGLYNPRAMELKNDKDIYKIYNERLVNKLESKIEQLEKEIEKRKNTEIKLQKMISEKEILLRELYHRTKNNIQVISSMLRLKARLTENDNVKEIFTEIENKILGIALIHQKLLETEDLSFLYLKDYLESLILLLRQNLLKPSDNVDISVKGDEIKILLDTAMPIGIIVNELISNSLKYAFPKNTRGRIEISLRSTEDNKIQLRICDNGVGLPEGFDIIRDGKLGLQTVYDLVNYQLAGKIRFENRNGLCFIITVGKELYISRV
ncbi:MAG: hypothetical protein APR54_10185 [Candidatus Cloacimonas sp. SDB]|nr:MAG: hypothetical protein APR54_10185 [Candidatus Cloacimonas sp. SDB]